MALAQHCGCHWCLWLLPEQCPTQISRERSPAHPDTMQHTDPVKNGIPLLDYCNSQLILGSIIPYNHKPTRVLNTAQMCWSRVSQMDTKCFINRMACSDLLEFHAFLYSFWQVPMDPWKANQQQSLLRFSNANTSAFHECQWQDPLKKSKECLKTTYANSRPSSYVQFRLPYVSHLQIVTPNTPSTSCETHHTGLRLSSVP
jgi:hypothetical protein